MNKLPDVFLARMERLLGEEFPAFAQSYAQPRRYGLRVNPLKICPARFEQIAPFHLQTISWLPGAYTYLEEDAVSRHPFYHAGLYYLQEPSAMTPASVLDVRPGMRVLDLCAAPGGKATALGARLAGEGVLFANEISASRAKALLKNIELFGISNAVVTNMVPARLAKLFPSYFDRVLVDAPCSGEGMFRKDENVIRAWDPEKPAKCAQIQQDIIRQAVRMLRPGGQLLYSTCTFSTKENEEIIAGLLQDCPEMELLPIPPREGFAEGLRITDEGAEIFPRGQAVTDGGAEAFPLEHCVRLWPHRTGGEGHFMALLKKRETAADRPLVSYAECSGFSGRQKKRDSRTGSGRGGKGGRRSAHGENRDDRTEEKILEAFLEEAGIRLPPGKPEIRNHQVFLPALPTAELAGVSFLRNGLYLGELKKDRFEPSQALAMALCCKESMSLRLGQNDERLAGYLSGETLELRGEEAAGRKGWVVVCVEEWPLGWGKISGSLLKNKYLASWRERS